MIREESLSEISDGRLYTENDMVRADTGNCAGCTQVCCRGMESSIVLDPYDVYRLTRRLQTTFDKLLDDKKIEINIVDGIMLPNMKMWIDMHEGSAYEHFIVSWHKYLKRTEAAVRELAAECASEQIANTLEESRTQNLSSSMTPEQQIRVICLYTLKTFYAAGYKAADENDFFREIEDRISKAYTDLGME